MECFHIFRITDVILCQKTHHLTPCHFGQSSLLLNLSIYEFSEFSRDKPNVRRYVFLDAPGIFPGCQIDDRSVLCQKTLAETVRPEFIQILTFTGNTACISNL